MARPRPSTAERRATRDALRAAAGGLGGLDVVLGNLNQQIKQIGVRSRGGMRKALLIVRRDSVKLTPVDTGNLRNSAFTEVEEEGGQISGVIGYTADYAAEVHETDKNYKRGQWKFLETALAQNHDAILRAIAEEVRLR